MDTQMLSSVNMDRGLLSIMVLLDVLEAGKENSEDKKDFHRFL